MVKYCLDTSVIVGILREHTEIVEKVRNLEGEVCTTVITCGELGVGLRLAAPERVKAQVILLDEFLGSLDAIWEVDQPVAEEYGRVKSNLAQKGDLIGDNDTWIAAVCLVHDAVLVTGNREHFKRVKGLVIA